MVIHFSINKYTLYKREMGDRRQIVLVNKTSLVTVIRAPYFDTDTGSTNTALKYGIAARSVSAVSKVPGMNGIETKQITHSPTH